MHTFTNNYKSFIFTKFKATEVTVDKNGRKTKKSVTTENPDIIRKLIDAESKSSKAGSSKKSKEPGVKKTVQKKSASKKAEVKKLPAPKMEKKKAIPKVDFKAPKLQINSGRTEKKQVKALPIPKKETTSKVKLSRNEVTGKAKINRTTGNLNESQVSEANFHSFDGNRGTILKNDYERYRNKIEFSGLSNSQKKKLLDKLYKMYEPKLRYESQWYSPMVSGPARYPQAKMDKIWERMMQANSDFVDWWKSIEPQLKNSQKTKAEKELIKNKAKEEDLKRIKENFNMWYQRALSDVEEYKKKNYPMKYNNNLCIAQSYLAEALKLDTKLYKDMFEKLNKIANYSKNSNVYKGYKLVLEGKLSSETIQRAEANDNKVIYQCDDYTVQNLSIQAGKRIAIKFVFYPKQQLVYALKKRGYTWYSSGKCFICKPEKFDLEWAKTISKQYEKYI